jgi:hypothetical protein
MPGDPGTQRKNFSSKSVTARCRSQLAVARSIVNNNRKQWIGARDHFLHLQVALFARPENIVVVAAE